MKHLAAALAIAMASGLLTSCTSGAELRLTGTSTIIDGPHRGPELCAGVVNNSLPPGCSGVPLRGLDVNKVDGVQTASGTTWVDRVSVTGVYDDDDGVLEVEDVRPPQPFPKETYDFSPGCPGPPAGWPPFDKRTNDHRAREKAHGVLEVSAADLRGRLVRPGHRGLHLPVHRRPGTAPGRARADPSRADLRGEAEAECPDADPHLEPASQGTVSGVLEEARHHCYGSIRRLAAGVEIDVVIGGRGRQQKLDERYAKYGEGVVVIRSALLKPV